MPRRRPFHHPRGDPFALARGAALTEAQAVVDDIEREAETRRRAHATRRCSARAAAIPPPSTTRRPSPGATLTQ